MPNYQQICNQVTELSKKAGSFIKKEKGKINSDNIETKSLHSYVTYVDKKAEKIIVDGLKKILPDAGFITEEETETVKSDKYNWIVDPLDGTTNFIHGLEPFSVSIALEEAGKIVIGVVYEVGKDECFYAYKDSPAYLNGKEIKVSTNKTLADSLIATGFPYYDYDKNSAILNSLEYFMKNTQGIRRFGSAATDLAYVACGRFDAFYEYSLNVWDVAAGTFIVQQAGGKVSDFKKGDNYLFGKEMVAANNLVYEEFADVIQKFLG
ncbi:MAG: inositol monophosphatase [Bacteroidales bacterium]|nr:inositol monophosphatase [Bacteroidales bacterium]